MNKFKKSFYVALTSFLFTSLFVKLLKAKIPNIELDSGCNCNLSTPSGGSSGNAGNTGSGSYY